MKELWKWWKSVFKFLKKLFLFSRYLHFKFWSVKCGSVIYTYLLVTYDVISYFWKVLTDISWINQIILLWVPSNFDVVKILKWENENVEFFFIMSAARSPQAFSNFCWHCHNFLFKNDCRLKFCVQFLLNYTKTYTKFQHKTFFRSKVMTMSAKICRGLGRVSIDHYDFFLTILIFSF